MPELGIYILYLGEEEIELDIDDIVPIADELSAEFTEQPSLYAYIAMLAARAEADWIDSKNALAECRAQTDKAVRLDLKSSDIKVTEPMVKAEIGLRRGYKEAVEFELDSHEQYLIMRALTQAMDMRAQMLISLGAHLRAEANQTGMLIRETKKKLTAAGIGRKRKRSKKSVDIPEGEFDPAKYGF